MSNRDSLAKFCNDVLDEFDNNKTDAVFCFLQSHKKLMTRYLKLVKSEEKGKQTVNSHLAKAITSRYSLKSTCQKNNKPNSMLIESFSELEEK